MLAVVPQLELLLPSGHSVANLLEEHWYLLLLLLFLFLALLLIPLFEFAGRVCCELHSTGTSGNMVGSPSRGQPRLAETERDVGTGLLVF